MDYKEVVTVIQLSGSRSVGLSLLFNHARGPQRFPVAVIWINNPLLLDITESERDFQIRPSTNIRNGIFHTSQPTRMEISIAHNLQEWWKFQWLTTCWMLLSTPTTNRHVDGVGRRGVTEVTSKRIRKEFSAIANEWLSYHHNDESP